MLYNQVDLQIEFAGSNKIIEAIICNKPILSGYSKAITYELGDNYPLFYNINYELKRFNKIINTEIDRINNILEKMINDPTYYNEFENYMKSIDKQKFLITYKNDDNVKFILNKIK